MLLERDFKNNGNVSPAKLAIKNMQNLYKIKARFFLSIIS